VVRAAYRFEGGDLIADRTRGYYATPLVARNAGVDPSALAARLQGDCGRPLLRLGATGAVPDHHLCMVMTPLGRGRVAVGDPDLALAALRAAGALGPGDTVATGGGRVALDLRPETLARFRRLADELRAAGCRVVPVPLLPTREHYVYLGYNNVLAETRADGLHVLMPTLGVPALDGAAARAWTALGATVHPIDCGAIFRLGGTVRCLCEPLARSEG
jgi:hypothetical protein